MGSVGTGSPDAGSVDQGSVDADSINAGRERLARYSLTGPENQAAVDAGLAGGAWFRSAVPRKRMKELMKRSDYPAVRDTAIWLGLILLFGAPGYHVLAGLAQLVGGPVLPRLRRPVRLDVGFPLARVRARHGVQDPLDRRRACTSSPRS